MKRKKSQKIEALVVKAIRGLQDVQGSTPREISNYISQEYDVPGPEIRQQVQFALKRGVTYGIFKRLKGGYYTYNKDFIVGQLMDGRDAAIEIRCSTKRGIRKWRISRCSRRKSGMSQRRGRGRRSGCGSCSRGRRRSKRSNGEKVRRDIKSEKRRAARSDSLSGKDSASEACTISGSSEEGLDDPSHNHDAPITSGAD